MIPDEYADQLVRPLFGHLATSLEARRAVGLAEQDPNLDRFLSVREALIYHGGYYGITRARSVERSEEMIDVFDPRAKADVRAPKLSTAGVDVELRRELWRYIRMLHSRGTTILLTTHYLEEAEALCEDIALITDGEIVARSTPDGLKRQFGVRTLEDVYLKAVHEPREAAA